jgi:hypothetical protein
MLCASPRSRTAELYFLARFCLWSLDSRATNRPPCSDEENAWVAKQIHLNCRVLQSNPCHPAVQRPAKHAFQARFRKPIIENFGARIIDYVFFFLGGYNDPGFDGITLWLLESIAVSEQATSSELLSIDGGEAVISAPFPPYRSLGEEETTAANRVLRSGVLSAFIGAAGQGFLGGLEV